MKPSEHRCQYTRSIPDSQSRPFPWQILAAGHGPAVQDITARALDGIMMNGIPVKVSQAHAPDEAREILALVPDIAVLILVLNSRQNEDWLALVPWTRQDLGNTRIRVAACVDRLNPEEEIRLLETYDINDIIVIPRDDFSPVKHMVIKALRTARAFNEIATKLNRKHRIETQLEEKKAAFNDLIENIGDMVWETGRDHRFSYVSVNTLRHYGYTWEEFHGKPFDFAMARETRSDGWPGIETAMAERREFTNVDISRIHRDGTPRYFLTSGRPIHDGQGRWKGFRGAEKDITALVHSEQEKKRLIAQLRHAQRLEAMGTLAGGIAHDFNNILGGILGYTQLIQFELKENPVALAHTEHIISGCNRAKNLILQILDFSRQRESTAPLKTTLPGNIVSEAVKLLRASIPSSIRLKTDIQKDPGQILADPSQIHQAVMNLCTNASQAIESGQGCISIQVKSVSLTPENHSRTPELDLDFGTYVTIAVSDTGRGIETNTLEKIFNPYFTTKKRGDGTGLGLSVVHGIVTRFNGVVTVDTRPGEGSTFTLYFPRYLEKKVPEKDHRVRLVGGKSNVLFIDDEPMLVDIGRMMLEKLGYRVTALETPLKGLDMIASDPGRFDIVITDMTMPDILGTQLADRIKKLNPDLPVVLATGFSNIVQTHKATPAGIDAVLPKPITLASLSQTLHQMLNG